MAKFNKDVFLKELSDKVQAAINNDLITKEDIDNDNTERLHSFIQYQLLEYVENRKCVIDILKNFNYDEKMPWEKLQKNFGAFESLLDIALVNLWLFLKSENAIDYAYYLKADNTNIKSTIDTENISNSDIFDSIDKETNDEEYPDVDEEERNVEERKPAVFRRSER